jgi:hypothetical protein
MLEEAQNVKGLCQQVHRLLSGIYWEALNEAVLDPLPEVMVLLIDVPRPWFGIGNLNWGYRHWKWNQVPWLILASDAMILENMPLEWNHIWSWNITLSDGW